MKGGNFLKGKKRWQWKEHKKQRNGNEAKIKKENKERQREGEVKTEREKGVEKKSGQKDREREEKKGEERKV